MDIALNKHIATDCIHRAASSSPEVQVVPNGSAGIEEATIQVLKKK